MASAIASVLKLILGDREPRRDLTDRQLALRRHRNKSLTGLPVTRSDGVLLGLLWRNDAERALAST